VAAGQTGTRTTARSTTRLDVWRLRALVYGFTVSGCLVATGCAPGNDGEQDHDPATHTEDESRSDASSATDQNDVAPRLDAAHQPPALPGLVEATSTDADRPATPTTERDAADRNASDASIRSDAGSRGTVDLALPLTIHLAGDSTVSKYADTPSTRDQAGWGQMLAPLFREGIAVDNRALGGRTARRFLDEKRLDELLDATQPGDYVFVQFGTNDGNRSATYELGGKTYPYYADPQTDFRATLQTYLERVAARGATPVLVTPPPRNSAYCTGGNGTGAHAEAMRQLGHEKGIAVLDLNARSVAYLKAICPAPQPEDFFLLRADGSVDGTHFQEHGARVLAELVAQAIVEADLPLSSALRTDSP